jgi:hypothetical protein
MILYVNGDSHSNGTDLVDTSLGWANLLAKKLNLTLVNDAKSGGSNPRILRTAGNFTTHSNPNNIFVVIGWTSWEREEWQVGQTYYDVNAGGHDALPENLELKYKTWVTEQNDDERICKSRITHEYIHKLHRHYKEKRIPHLFFNAVMPFQHNLTDTQVTDWHDNFLGPYDNDLSYYWYLKKAGHKHTKFNHYPETAQVEWADLLYKYIVDKKIL